MVRVAVFAEAALKRNLKASKGKGVGFEFFAVKGSVPEMEGFDGAVVELTANSDSRLLNSLRQALPGVALGSLSLRSDAALIQRSARLGFDFHLASWGPGMPPLAEIAARLAASKPRSTRTDAARRARLIAKRLAILTDVVKTANSLLEPRKVIEAIMVKIQKLIPSDAWSMLLVDEEKQDLTFELALGEKGKDLSALRIKMGEGVAGWVARSGKPAIVNDVSQDTRFSGRFDDHVRFRTRSILCAPLNSRGRTIGVVEIINRRGGPFTRADLEVLLTLVEPCAIAIENAMLFQKAEHLTVTDDLTKLFNSRYLTLFIGREIKRCKRHGIPLSVIFLDLDGFKSVNDQYGHLAGSRMLAEVGEILTAAARESDVLARYGGDEFVVVLPETPPSGALVIAERIRKSIESHPFLEAHGLQAHISASFGIASYPDHALTPEGLIQKADQAMYRIKERDKNGIEVAV